MEFHPSSFVIVWAAILLVTRCNTDSMVLQPPFCECGTEGQSISSNRIERIVSGAQAQPHQFPWMAVILYHGRLICGGALVSDRHIITAGHCVNRNNTDGRYSIKLGSHRVFTIDDFGLKGFEASNENQRVYSVESIVKAPNFHSINFGPEFLNMGYELNDLAVVKLDRKVIFTHAIKPICLPENGSQDYTGRKAIVAGWGRLANGDRPEFLNMAEVTVISKQQCQEMDSVSQYLAEGMMCVQPFSGVSCRGDSGGPLFLEKSPKKYEIIGVVSWGIGCTTTAPGIYSNISFYLPWIRENTEDGMFCGL